MDSRFPARARLSPPQRVAVLRALKLGDMLCAVPALRALRLAWPKAEIVLIGLPWASEFAARFSDYIDDFRELPGYPGLAEQEPQPARFAAFLADMQRQPLDLAIQLHGSGVVSNPLVMLLGARQAAGFYVPGQYCPSPATFAPWPERGLEVDRLLALIEFLGLPARGRGLEFPLDERDLAELDSLPEADNLVPGRYVCIHPGASTPLRRWPPLRFAAVADRLAGLGYTIVLTGVDCERSLTGEVAAAMERPAIDMTGRLRVGGVAALIGGAALLVATDTGVSHVAAALEPPSVVISTGDNPQRWAPASRRLHRVLSSPSGVCEDDVWCAANSLLDPLDRPHLAGRPRARSVPSSRDPAFSH